MAHPQAKGKRQSNIFRGCIHQAASLCPELNFERYNEGLALLPNDYREVIIDGGCHTFFGTYTGQDEALSKISSEEQIAITADEILKLIENE